MLLRQAVLAVVFATTVGTAFAASNRVGDVNADDVVDSADVAYLATYLVGDGPAPQGPADVNGDGGVNVRDVFYLINFVFASGPGPVCAGATGGPCNTGGAGICAFGTVACSNGALVCVQNQQPQPDVGRPDPGRKYLPKPSPVRWPSRVSSWLDAATRASILVEFARARSKPWRPLRNPCWDHRVP